MRVCAAATVPPGGPRPPAVGGTGHDGWEGTVTGVAPSHS